MNNVNVGEMERFITAIRKDPAQAKKEKRVTGSWAFEQGAPQFISTLDYAEGKAVLSAELPPFAGGWGTSPDPVQYCLYGVAACFAAVRFPLDLAPDFLPLARAILSSAWISSSLRIECHFVTPRCFAICARSFCL